jgi:hypothetical protein
MSAIPWAVYPLRMNLALALTATQKGAVLLLVTGVAAPIAGWWFAHSAAAWRTLGNGRFSIDTEPSPAGRRPGPSAPVDPAIQAAEVRQMLTAKAERQRRRGEAPVDVEAEAARLLEAPPAPEPDEEMAAELRAEVRHLVIVRNERRMHKGLEPLDVERETDRQLADLIGSGR